MIIAINYANEKFKFAQKFNSKSALRYGADKVVEYGPQDIDKEFHDKYASILDERRGAGYWLWMPYIVLKTLENSDEGDIIVYTDSGSVFINSIYLLTDVLNEKKLDIMAFCNNTKEIQYSKRDALILMDADKPEYLNTNQACGGFAIVRNTTYSKKVFTKYLEYASDRRINTDDPNTLGFDNYPEFIENRHNQTVWSLLCKKERIPLFRDPSQVGLETASFSEEILKQSSYPQVICLHRIPDIKYEFQLEYNDNYVKKILRYLYSVYKLFIRILRKICVLNLLSNRAL